MLRTLRLTGMTQLSGSTNVRIHAIDVYTMQKWNLQASTEEIPFFKRILDTGENFLLDVETSVIYSTNNTRISNREKYD